MDRRCQELTDDLHEKCEGPISMKPMTGDSAPSNSPEGGVCLFTENSQKHLGA